MGPSAGRLADLLADPGTARAVLRSLMRDLRLQVRNGLLVPSWAHDVLTELAAVAEVDGPDIGTKVANVVGMGQMTSVADAATAVGCSEEYVRRLVRTGRVRGQRVGERTWLVDIESLQGVVSNAHQVA